MNKCRIEGNKTLKGKVIISGSKNAALPILFMTILTEEEIKISNIPKIVDVDIAIKLLKCLGAKVIHKKFLYINTSRIHTYCPPACLVKKIRASIWILAPLLSRFRQAKIFFPGGCNIGQRSIDLHITGLIELGAKITLKDNYIQASVIGRLQGKYISIKKISVGATITIMSAATLAEGLTIINNAAREPEIVDVANFLNTLGADIIGAGSSIIYVKGVVKLNGGQYRVIPDRIETGTFLIAAAISKGNIICHKTQPKHLKNVINKLSEVGSKIKIGKNWIHLDMRGKKPKSTNICTSPYPGFPTDMQSQFALLNTISTGIGKITETIFENRFLYASELVRMGARLNVKNNTIICHGVPKLISANVVSTDLRASATLVLAGCVAEGITIVNHIHYLLRGYEWFLKKLNKLGANITII